MLLIDNTLQYITGPQRLLDDGLAHDRESSLHRIALPLENRQFLWFGGLDDLARQFAQVLDASMTAIGPDVLHPCDDLLWHRFRGHTLDAGQQFKVPNHYHRQQRPPLWGGAVLEHFADGRQHRAIFATDDRWIEPHRFGRLDGQSAPVLLGFHPVNRRGVAVFEPAMQIA